ncbi:hypothetical protein GGR42_000255 [Saonia flava]|uniref:Outer membrane protein beta-barrel domain-containing protein n=1 Tax=Saonia flava TaxID=523696 RepID=A0A846QTY4_9FLAO|nr:hypothetical protein [Saonia flava]NJB69793.1 hypothetical protein [Saonia flava]
MKQSQFIIAFLVVLSFGSIHAQEDESEDYIEFNDRRNIVHGVYLGFSGSYGKVAGYDSGLFGIKLAYVANQQFEVGFAATAFYADQNLPNVFPDTDGDLLGAYGGLHLEPIFFGKKKVNLSFPVLLGSGIVGYIEDIEENPDPDFDEDSDTWDIAFIVEPGVSLLYNINRYVQLELGAKYRFSNEVKLTPDSIKNINGFSAGFGIKLGVFNLGRNRYKKSLDNEN